MTRRSDADQDLRTDLATTLQPALTRRSNAAGAAAEEAVAQRLARKGFRVLLRNVRTPAGEVDIVAERLGVLYFVEVKARTLGGPAGRPEEALTPRKLARVANAADSILRRRGLSEAPRRLLGAAVDLDPSGAPVDVRLVPVEEIR